MDKPLPKGVGDSPPDEDSFLDLLAEIGRRPVNGDRRDIVGLYQAWIGRNTAASPALYGACFNLGVELSAAGDSTGAIEAYQKALALRPGFYPASINLGTLMETAGQPDAALAIWGQALQPDESRATMLEYRERLAELRRVEELNTPTVLHVGCGAQEREQLPAAFQDTPWREIRLDIDPAVRPDFIANMTDMHAVSDGLVDVVYAAQTIEQLYPHELALALLEAYRVLKPDGFILITVPDLQEVARHIAEDRLEEPLYMSPAGPIAALDILYGHRPSLANNKAFVAPRTGFTGGTLTSALIKAGFAAVLVQRELPAFRLTAIAFRNPPDDSRVALVQARMLSPADHTAVLYRAVA
jgi:SAM-dependent methyltransferase